VESHLCLREGGEGAVGADFALLAGVDPPHVCRHAASLHHDGPAQRARRLQAARPPRLVRLEPRLEDERLAALVARVQTVTVVLRLQPAAVSHGYVLGRE